MRIMGIDPGSLCTGFGVVDISLNTETYVTSGVINLSNSLSERLETLFNDLHLVHEKYQPTHVVIEGLFAHINWRSSLVMAHARGVIMLVAKQHGCCFHELQPRVVKKSITGSGSASKQVVAVMVAKRLNIKHVLKIDASDALALALSYPRNIFLGS